ncbi:hypothetical protein CRUP_001234, partial [Coryphaenoides rupestris]
GFAHSKRELPCHQEKEVTGERVPGWKAHHLGQLHDQQDARHPAALLLGDDVCLRPLGELRGVRRPGQHLLHLQPEDPRGQRAGHPRAARAHRWAGLRSQSLKTKGLRLDCTVGHRDGPAGHHLHGPHGGRDESVPEPGLQDLRVGGLRRLLQAVGRPGRHVQAVLHGTRVRHQRRL